MSLSASRFLIAAAIAITASTAGQAFAFNPQPDPPGRQAVYLNPQPEPPGKNRVFLNPQPLPPGYRVMLNPQPLPPRVAPTTGLSTGKRMH